MRLRQPVGISQSHGGVTPPGQDPTARPKALLQGWPGEPSNHPAIPESGLRIRLGRSGPVPCPHAHAICAESVAPASPPSSSRLPIVLPTHPGILRCFRYLLTTGATLCHSRTPPPAYACLPTHPLACQPTRPPACPPSARLPSSVLFPARLPASPLRSPTCLSRFPPAPLHLS